MGQFLPVTPQAFVNRISTFSSYQYQINFVPIATPRACTRLCVCAREEAAFALMSVLKQREINVNKLPISNKFCTNYIYISLLQLTFLHHIKSRFTWIIPGKSQIIPRPTVTNNKYTTSNLKLKQIIINLIEILNKIAAETEKLQAETLSETYKLLLLAQD